MTQGRTLDIFARLYLDGYDVSGYIRSIGELKWEFGVSPDASLTDQVKNILIGQASIGIGAFNGFFDNTDLGLHAVTKGAGVKRVVMIPTGIQAVPAQGDPVFMGEFEQRGYHAAVDKNYIVANLTFDETNAIAANIAYTKPWGTLLHANAAKTAVNSAVGVDCELAASSAKGGFLCYQIFAVAGAGTVTIKVQEAATNTDVSFGDLAGASSGAIAHTAVPCAGIVALGTTATIQRYLRWQIGLSGITSVTFALGFVRAN